MGRRGLFAAGSFITSAPAQLVIPHGHYNSDFEKYLVAAVSLAASCFRGMTLLTKSAVRYRCPLFSRLC